MVMPRSKHHTKWKPFAHAGFVSLAHRQERDDDDDDDRIWEAPEVPNDSAPKPAVIKQFPPAKMPTTMLEVNSLAVSAGIAKACVYLARMRGGRPAQLVGLGRALRACRKVKMFVVHPVALAEAMIAAKVPGFLETIPEELRAQSPSNWEADLEVPSIVVEQACKRFCHGTINPRAQGAWVASVAYLNVEVGLDALVCGLEKVGALTTAASGKLTYKDTFSAEEVEDEEGKGKDAAPHLSAWPLAPLPVQLKKLKLVQQTMLVLVPPTTAWRQFVEIKEKTLVAPLSCTPFPRLALLWKFVPKEYLVGATHALSKALQSVPPFRVKLDLMIDKDTGIVAKPQSTPSQALSDLQQVVVSLFPQSSLSGFDPSPQIRLVTLRPKVLQSEQESSKVLGMYKQDWKAIEFEVRHALCLENDKLSVSGRKGKGKGKLRTRGIDEPWTVVGAIPLEGVPADEQPVLQLNSRAVISEQRPHDYQQLLQNEEDRQAEQVKQQEIQRLEREKEQSNGYQWHAGPTSATECADPEYGYQPEEFGAPAAPFAKHSKSQTNAEERRERRPPRSNKQIKAAHRAEEHKAAQERDTKKRWCEKQRRRERDTKVQIYSRTISNLEQAA